MSISSALPFGVLGILLIDLIFALGDLRRKIFLIKIVFILFTPMLFVYKITIIENMELYNLFITTVAALLIITVDFTTANIPVINYTTYSSVPFWLKFPRPIRSFFEIFLRLFPSPVEPCLIQLGKGGDENPIIVTGNYYTTVRRVYKELKNYNGWLLVCNSRGINLWCSSLAGHFSEKEIIDAIEFTQLKEKTKQNKIILPQLCAGNVNIEEIKVKSYFNCKFGPFHINNISDYFKNPNNETIGQSTFSLKERSEMALASPIILIIILLIIFNFLGLHHLTVIIPLIFLFSFIHGIIYTKKPISNNLIWSILYGTAVFTFLLSIHFYIPEKMTLIAATTTGLSMIYGVNEFLGWSPLEKYSLSQPAEPIITIDTIKCVGCKRCIDVCPRGVFSIEKNKAQVQYSKNCIHCTSCFIQCPEKAINHSSDNRFN